MPDTDDHVKVERSAGLDAAAPEPRKPRLQGFLGLVGRLDYVPPSCRWNPESPPRFNWLMCLLFAFVRPPFLVSWAPLVLREAGR